MTKEELAAHKKAHRQRPDIKAKRKAYQKAWRAANLEETKAYSRAYEKSHREQRREHLQRPEVKAQRNSSQKTKGYGARWYKLHKNDPGFKEKRKQNKLAREFGLTVERYEKMLSDQNGRCAICKTSDWSGPGKSPCVDHDHGPRGKVRGILCRNCNVAVGLIKDDEKTALRMAAYLRGKK